MTKSLLPEAVKLLGLEIGEEFNFCGYRKNVMIDEDGYVLEPTDSGEWKRSKNFTFADLLRVPHEIRKLPWKPRDEEKYYVFCMSPYSADSGTWKVTDSVWLSTPQDIALFDKGWIYRTREEAEAALPAVAKELGVEYKIEGAL